MGHPYQLYSVPDALSSNRSSAFFPRAVSLLKKAKGLLHSSQSGPPFFNRCHYPPLYSIPVSSSGLASHHIRLFLRGVSVFLFGISYPRLLSEPACPFSDSHADFVEFFYSKPDSASYQRHRQQCPGNPGDHYCLCSYQADVSKSIWRIASEEMQSKAV